MQPKRAVDHVTVISLYGTLLQSPREPEFDLLVKYKEQYNVDDLIRIVHRTPMDDRQNPRDRDNRVRNRAVRIVGTNIYVSNRKLADLQNNTFELVAPPPDYHLPRKQVDAAKIIWKAWCIFLDNPVYAICKRRLCQEYNEMATEL